MRVKKGALYCAEHLTADGVVSNGPITQEDFRIPCPLDPAHSVYQSRLKAHLKKCNARNPEMIPSYFSENLNLLCCDEHEEESERLPSITDLVERINRVYSEVLSKDNQQHEISHRLPGEKGKIVSEADKHRLQQEALTALILKDISMKKDKVVVLEFGAGKGGLSNFIWESYFMKHPEVQVEFILIDRSNSRCKRDAKMKNEGAAVRRIFIDIKDLDLKDLLKFYDDERTHFLWISKHLCGAATCLTLNSLSKLDESIKGSLCVALCCHQCCSWSSYVNREFLYATGLLAAGEGERVFKMLCSLTSWAVCCFREDKGEVSSDGDDDDDDDSNSNTHTPAKRSKLKAEEVEYSDEKKESTGRMIKRLLDHGRELKLTKGGSIKCELKHYIEENVTLENAVLCGSTQHNKA